MDLGIKGRKALVCAASKGLGRACATSLAREGVDVVITARTAEIWNGPRTRSGARRARRSLPSQATSRPSRAARPPWPPARSRIFS